jgi:hypothetical protein
MISVLSLVLVSIFAVAVFAENDYDTPGITDNSLNIWNVSAQTPDGDLTYMFDNAGKYPGLIRHLLKDANSGHIYETRVKVYYQTPPAVVTVNTTGYANMCFFRNNNINTRMRMSIGSTIVYDQVAYSEEQRISARTEFWKYDGNTGNRTLRTPPTNNEFRDRESRVCRDIGGEAYTTTIYRERCGSREGDSTCNGADTDNNFSLGDYNESTETRYNPAISSNCTGGTCRFGDRSFSAAWAPDGVNMGYDPGTGLYFALVNVSISRNDINNEDNPNQIRFKLNAPGSYAIGHQRNDAGDAEFGQRFGLGNKIVVGDAEPNRGVKLALPFGMSCSASATTQSMTIGLYDADRDTFANTYMYVIERDPETDARRRIPVSEFSGGSRVIPQTYRFIADTYTYNTGNAAVSRVTFTAQKGMQYMFVVVNPGGQAGQSQEPGQNVFSVALPTDSIQGIVNCKYELQPMLDDIPQTFEYSPNFRVHGYIQNNRVGAVVGGDREWQVNKLVFNARPANYPGAVMNNSSNPCDRMKAGNTGYSPSCEVLNAQTYPTSSDWDRNPYTEAANYPAGTYICFMTSIRQPRWDSTTTQWAHSAMKCSVSVKHPSLAVSYGDIRTGGSFGACSITLAGSNRGLYHGIVGHNYSDGMQHSYVNGAALSTGTISSFASLSVGPGSGVRGYFGRGPATPTSTFNGMFYGDVNTAGAPSPLRTHCLSPTFEAGRYATTSSGATTVQTHVLSGTNPNLVLGDITLGPNQRQVIRVTGSGTVQLNGNISYTGSATNIYALPQFVLLVDSQNINVVVRDHVTRLDGIYAGQGSFYTCYSHAATTNGRFDKWTTAAFCPSQLTVNGAVIMGDRLYPYRTAGHNSAADRAPAEVFNLRPDILLSDYADGGTTPSLSTSSQRELAPRY